MVVKDGDYEVASSHLKVVFHHRYSKGWLRGTCNKYDGGREAGCNPHLSHLSGRLEHTWVTAEKKRWQEAWSCALAQNRTGNRNKTTSRLSPQQCLGGEFPKTFGEISGNFDLLTTTPKAVIPAPGSTSTLQSSKSQMSRTTKSAVLSFTEGFQASVRLGNFA